MNRCVSTFGVMSTLTVIRLLKFANNQRTSFRTESTFYLHLVYISACYCTDPFKVAIGDTLPAGNIEIITGKNESYMRTDNFCDFGTP